MNKLLPSMLFVPAGDGHKLAKLPSLRAPAFILDLEDAVANSAKARAREAVGTIVADPPPIRAPLYVRVNSATPSALYEDLACVVRRGLHGIVLPKVNSADDVRVTDWAISALEQRHGVAAGQVTIMPTIETVAGLESLRSIATGSRRIQCLIFGAGDFSLDVGLDWPPPDGTLSPLLIGAKGELVRVSRLAGLQPPHDGVYPLFRDHEGLVREAQQSRGLGMFGKHAIHPAQIERINTVFTPSAPQVNRAHEVLAAFSESESRGVANIDVDGQFIDYPVAARARQLLELAAELGAEPA